MWTHTGEIEREREEKTTLQINTLIILNRRYFNVIKGLSI